MKSRRLRTLFTAISLFVPAAVLCAQDKLDKVDTNPHTAQMIPVDKDVKLEVLDWGGTGHALVLLTGLGDNAHVFDTFAPKLNTSYHVYGITRRGFGVSSKPVPDATNYTAGRLGEDVLAVIDALHLNKPVLAGHSLAGEELSYIGTSHPDKVAGLIFLDAGYPYALYDEANGSVFFDSAELRHQLELLLPGKTPTDPAKFLNELQLSLARMQKWVTQQQEDFKVLPPLPPAGQRPDPPPVITAIMSGQQKFTTFSVPALLIFASPHDRGEMFKDNPSGRAVVDGLDKRNVERQAIAFERQVPSAHVV